MTLVGEMRRLVDVSIVIPAFNEQDRIGQTLRRVSEYLSERRLSSELIVVDDGSTDATALIVRAFQPANHMLVLHRKEINVGKGAAVKAGMLLARGMRRLFVDADLSTDIVCLDKALNALDRGADIVIGSRHIDGSMMAVRQSVLRQFAGIGFRTLVRLLFRLPVKDSQNGFKVFTAEAAEQTFGALCAVGWAFDVELLVRADRLGFRIHEVPIVWRDDRRSRLKIWHMPRTVYDLVRARIVLQRMPAPSSRAAPDGSVA